MIDALIWNGAKRRRLRSNAQSSGFFCAPTLPCKNFADADAVEEDALFRDSKITADSAKVFERTPQKIPRAGEHKHEHNRPNHPHRIKNNAQKKSSQKRSEKIHRKKIDTRAGILTIHDIARPQWLASAFGT